MIQAIKLMLREITLIDVYFDDSSVKRFDVLSLANKYPQLNALKDRELFLKGKLLGWSAICWNDDLDLDTEIVYEDGVDVSDEYDDIEVVVLGHKIKEKRLELNLTQTELAERIDIEQSDLSKIEKGLLNPSIKMIKRIAKGLNASISLTIN